MSGFDPESCTSGFDGFSEPELLDPFESDAVESEPELLEPFESDPFAVSGPFAEPDPVAESDEEADCVALGLSACACSAAEAAVAPPTSTPRHTPLNNEIRTRNAAVRERGPRAAQIPFTVITANVRQVRAVRARRGNGCAGVGASG
ncbi:hypothetical protein QFW96_21200 [Saccharopolyspora sp. TS4A08]|uniref:Uncharacterized protein n=1 Tax=Saccharopolyspora ipomoeae TaxID=3042027 RepID=A0ABT6PT25_9PSEU|nr:hypothetical protein [Saccharopolyspora sp. TS4A08]